MPACSHCGRETPFHLLDSKPPRFAGRPFTLRDYEVAADTGEQFTVLECEPCYGPAFSIGIPE